MHNKSLYAITSNVLFDINIIKPQSICKLIKNLIDQDFYVRLVTTKALSGQARSQLWGPWHAPPQD